MPATRGANSGTNPQKMCQFTVKAAAWAQVRRRDAGFATALAFPLPPIRRAARRCAAAAAGSAQSASVAASTAARTASVSCPSIGAANGAGPGVRPNLIDCATAR